MKAEVRTEKPRLTQMSYFCAFYLYVCLCLYSRVISAVAVAVGDELAVSTVSAVLVVAVGV